jgi:hypothetical protein
MEPQPNMMEKGKVKKGKMEMPMTGGPSLGLLLLPAPALLVPIHRIAERNCLINSWRASRPRCTAGARGQNGASLPPFTRSRDPKIGPTLIYQTVSEGLFAEIELSAPEILGKPLRPGPIAPTTTYRIRPR